MAKAINEEFNPWSGSVSPDGVWRLAGSWFGTGNNQFDLSRETLTSTYPGETASGFLKLTITPSANPLQGGEIQTLEEYGYGYYEVRMKPSDVSGGVASFFLVDFDGPWHEYDIEFLLNSHNQVTFSNYNGAGTTYYDLGFDPTADFHTYGILWEPGKVTNYVDGKAVHSETNAYFVSDADGMNIMMNAWSGNANFGGGPPAQNSTTVYDWVHFTPLSETPPSSAGTVSINNVTISEGNSGTKVATFTATRSGGTAAFDVDFATADATATAADGDYVAASNTLHFAANQNTQTISVAINGDTKVEANETFSAVLSKATGGATISDGQGVGTITNDDVAATAGTVSINNVTISEGNSGTKVATFTATRSGGTAAFDVDFATADATATVADGDYVAASNTLHFAANQNTQTISVAINGDTKVETNETFNAVLSKATGGATIIDGQGVGTIANDDVGGTAPAGIEFANLSQIWRGITKIQGTAEPGSVIKLYDGLTSLGSAAADADGSWTFIKALSNAVHTITAHEVDSSGQVVSTSSGAALLGSDRSDILRGTPGSDLFVGKDGQDTFVFAANFGNDVIRDFDAFGRKHDVLEFSKNDFDSFASVLSHAGQVGRDVVISAGSDTLTLKNIKLGALDSHDFYFA